MRPTELIILAQGVAYPDNIYSEAAFVDLQHYNSDASGLAQHLFDSIATVDGHPIELRVVDDKLAHRLNDPFSESPSTVLVRDASRA